MSFGAYFGNALGVTPQQKDLKDLKNPFPKIKLSEPPIYPGIDVSLNILPDKPVYVPEGLEKIDYNNGKQLANRKNCYVPL